MSAVLMTDITDPSWGYPGYAPPRNRGPSPIACSIQSHSGSGSGLSAATHDLVRNARLEWLEYDMLKPGRRAFLSWDKSPENILIIKKMGDERALRALRDVARFLQDKGRKVYVEDVVHERDCKDLLPLEDNLDKIDLVVTLGGDGTVLYLASLFRRDMPMPPTLSFSMGTLGFLTPFDMSQYERALEHVLEATTEKLGLTDSLMGSEADYGARGESQMSGESDAQFGLTDTVELSDDEDSGGEGEPRNKAERAMRHRRRSFKKLLQECSHYGKMPYWRPAHAGSAVNATVDGRVEGGVPVPARVGGEGSGAPLSDTEDAWSEFDGRNGAGRRAYNGNGNGGSPRIVAGPHTPVPASAEGPTGLPCTLRYRMRCETVLCGVVQDLQFALNEAVIERGSSPAVIDVECFIDGVHVTNIQSDGLIIATPSGSTAYSRSAGGPMVAPSVACTVITPVAPFSLSFRPIVVPDTTCIDIRVPCGSRTTPQVTFDGRPAAKLEQGSFIRCHTAMYPMPVITPEELDMDWYEGITQKLSWNQTIRHTRKLTIEEATSQECRIDVNYEL
ncbi:unnamed protein product [Pedinophyceae sp. YPF-701]|nr:unnamed protein product [Pedinophyceae sp. YPF-701]